MWLSTWQLDTLAAVPDANGLDMGVLVHRPSGLRAQEEPGVLESDHHGFLLLDINV